jgi:AcrR family transcriptional regulator
MDGMTPASRTPAPEAAPRPPGLRERKKLRTRLAIRRAAFALFREQGYDATTVERIAERADVSPSTVARYFPAKEDIVLTDAYEPLLEELLRHRPADEPVPETLRWVLRRLTALPPGGPPHHDDLLLRVRLLAEVPAVRARLLESGSGTARLMRRALAARTGRDESDPEVRLYAMGLTGALLEAMALWVEGGCRDDLARLADHALDVFRDLPDTR